MMIIKKTFRFLSTRPLSQLSILGIILGVSFGLISRQLKPSDDIVLIMGYIGSLFINCLKAIVLIFVIIIMMRTPLDMKGISDTKKYSTLTILYFIGTSFLSSLIGLAMVNIIRPGAQSYICTIKSSYSTKVENAASSKGSLIGAVLGVGKQALPENIMRAITEDNLLGVLTVFLTIGFALSKYSKTNSGIRMKETLDLLYKVILDILVLIIAITPLGVFSIISSELSKITDNCIFVKMSVYIATFVAANIVLVFVFYPVLYFIVVRKNPFTYARTYLNAYLTAFSAASSAAALPLNLKAAYDLGIDKSVANFVLPLGSTLNMNGSSIYYPVTIMFIAFLNNQRVGVGTQLITCFVATFVTVGGAPIPSGALVYLLLVANSVGIDLPTQSVSLIWAIDPLMDRLLTTSNIIGDGFAVAVIDRICKKFFPNKTEFNDEEVKENVKETA